MRKILKNAVCGLLFIAILASLFLAASAAFKPDKTANVNALEDPLANGMLTERKNSIDVIFLGDSEVYSTFIPLKIWDEHGIASYVCGSSDQVLSFSYELAVKSFKMQKPKIVVLETNNIFRDVTSANVFINKAEALFSVFKYHDRWKDIQPKSWQMTGNKTYDRKSKGFLFNTSVNPADVDGYMSRTDEKETIKEENKHYLKSINNYCRKNGAKFMLVSVPSTKNWNYRKHNAVTEISNELGIEYVDMNTIDALCIDWKRDTRDGGDHLNYFGASKATDWFGKYLAGMAPTQNIKDKRNNAEYTEWNKNATEFKRKVNKDLV